MKKVIEFTYEDEDDTYSCHCTVYYSIDSDYGSDADGNRGVDKVFLEDIFLNEIFDINQNELKERDLDERVVDDILEFAEGRFYEG